MIMKRGTTWRVRVYVGVDPYTKEEVYMNDTAYTEREAVKMEAKFKTDAGRSKTATIEQRMFPSYAIEWLAQKKLDIMPNTYGPYVTYIKTASERFKYFKMSEIQKHHIAKYLTDLTVGDVGPARRGKLSNNTVSKQFFVLRSLFFDALEYNSPMVNMKPPKKAKKKIPIPTDEQAQYIIDWFRNDVDMFLAIVMAINHSMREGEIFALEWGDIRKGSIRVNKSIKLAEENQWVIGPPKSENSTRTIAIDPETDALFEAKKAKDGMLNLKGSIFPFTKNAFYHRFKKVVHEQLHAEFTFHSLRHYCLTKLAEEGFSDPFVAERAGHDQNVLRAIYKHLGVKAKDEQDIKVMKRKIGN